MNPIVSVIVPTWNEENYIDNFIQNVLEQDYPQDRMEILIADGRSKDRTREHISKWIEKYPIIQLLDNPHQYVPQALNICLDHSKGEIIVRLDAHSIYPKNYISCLVEQLCLLNAQNVGGVWITEPGSNSIEAKSIALATADKIGIGNVSYRLGEDQIKEVDTVPYGCFPRKLFDEIGQFDTDLLRNQDDEFNGRIIKNGGKIFIVPDIKIRYSARSTFKKMRRMFFQYGEFKPLVNIKLGSPATIRQFAPPGLVLLHAFVALTFTFVAPLAIAGSFLLLLYYYVIYRRSLQLAYVEQNQFNSLATPITQISKTLRIVFYLSSIAAFNSLPHVTSMWPKILFSSVFLILPGILDIIKLDKGHRSLLVKLIVCFPQIHFSYGFGYIFGLVEWGILRKHNSKKSFSVKENR